jgi:hypothetical protein
MKLENEHEPTDFRFWRRRVFSDVTPCSLVDIDRSFRVLTASTIQTTTSEKTAIFLRKMFHSVHGLFDNAVSSSNDGMNIEWWTGKYVEERARDLI